MRQTLTGWLGTWAVSIHSCVHGDTLLYSVLTLLSDHSRSHHISRHCQTSPSPWGRREQPRSWCFPCCSVSARLGVFSSGSHSVPSEGHSLAWPGLSCYEDFIAGVSRSEWWRWGRSWPGEVTRSLSSVLTSTRRFPRASLTSSSPRSLMTSPQKWLWSFLQIQTHNFLSAGWVINKIVSQNSILSGNIL